MLDLHPLLLIVHILEGLVNPGLYGVAKRLLERSVLALDSGHAPVARVDCLFLFGLGRGNGTVGALANGARLEFKCVGEGFLVALDVAFFLQIHAHLFVQFFLEVLALLFLLLEFLHFGFDRCFSLRPEPLFGGAQLLYLALPRSRLGLELRNTRAGLVPVASHQCQLVLEFAPRCACRGQVGFRCCVQARDSLKLRARCFEHFDGGFPPSLCIFYALLGCLARRVGLFLVLLHEASEFFLEPTHALLRGCQPGLVVSALLR